MKDKAKYMVDTLVLICIPAMTLLFLLLICYTGFLRTMAVTNIYSQVVCLYGIPILISLCILPMKLVGSNRKEIGLCRNKRIYQDFIAIMGIITLSALFFHENSIDKIEGAYVLQFIFVGLGEEIFFRAILYQHIKNMCNSSAIAILIVAAIFGCLFHSDGGIAALLLIRMPLSILFSLIYGVTGSLSIPIILHALYNILV